MLFGLFEQALLFGKQAGIFNGDPGLAGNGLHQLEIVLIEGILLLALDVQDAGDGPIGLDRHEKLGPGQAPLHPDITGIPGHILDQGWFTLSLPPSL